MKKLTWTILLLIFIPLAGVKGSPREKIAFVHPLVKIKTQRDIPRGRIEPHLAGARGESESIQIVWTGRKKGQWKILPQPLYLRGKGTSAQISPRRISVYQVQRVTLRRRSKTNYFSHFILTGLNFLKGKEEPYTEKISSARWPDPLLPGNSQNLSKRDIPIFWLTISIPRSAHPGRYEGKIKCLLKKEKKTRTFEVSYSLQVWKTTFPLRPQLRTAFGLSRKGIKLREKIDSKSRLEGRLRRYREALLKRKISPTYIARPKIKIRRPSGKVHIDWRHFDREIAYYEKRGLTGFNMTWFGLPRHWTFSFDDGRDLWEGKWQSRQKKYQKVRDWLDDKKKRELAAKILVQTERHLRKKGWLDRGYIYIVDEPFIAALPTLRAEYRWVKKTAPDLKILQTVNNGTCPWYPFFKKSLPPSFRSLEGVVDIWVPNGWIYGEEYFQKRRKEGQEVWIYTCIADGRPYHNCWQIDASGAFNQIGFWYAWKERIDGYLYWNATSWTRANPWENPMTFPGGNGDGSLFYPHSKKIIPSQRLEIIGDGIEIYQLFWELEKRKEKWKKEGKTKLVRRAEKLLKVEDLVRSLKDFTGDFRSLERRRRAVGKLLDEN